MRRRRGIARSLLTSNENFSLSFVFFILVAVSQPEERVQVVGATDIATDAAALLAFKVSIASDPQEILASWLSSNVSSLCFWLGVTCSGGRVSSLQLSDIGLSGTLPPELGNLTALKILDLSGNYITGQIPGSLGGLHRLVQLNLSSNKLTGSIPETLGNLKVISYLDLESNMLTGAIPTSMNNLQQLETLKLGDNRLTGRLSSGLADQTSLFNLELHQNQLTGPIPGEYFVMLRNLKYLTMYNNLFSGSIPAQIGQAFQLGYLDLSNNQLTGSIPSEICGLHNLTNLYLSGNWITGVIPVELSKCSSLQYLDLSDNNLTGSIPSELNCKMPLIGLFLGDNQLSGSLPNLGNCSLLNVLNLTKNSLSGPIPSSYGQVQQVYLSQNNLSGPLPSTYSRGLTTITTLDASNNHLSGELPPQLFETPNLLLLNLSNNELTGAIPGAVGNLLNAINIDLGGNRLNGEIPSTVGKLGKNLISFILSGNDLNGVLIPELGNLTNLQTLDLSNNNFWGPLSTSINNLTNLVVLNLANNSLTGDLHNKLENLVSLSVLDLSNNFLSGSIPSAIDALKVVEFLSLASNGFRGTIPLQIGHLEHLESLNLSQNQLEGPIPPNLSLLSRLRDLDLSDNSLNGSIPSGLLSNFPPLAYTGNAGLCGKPLSRCRVNLQVLSSAAIAGTALGGIVLAFAMLALLAVAVRCRRNRPGLLIFFGKTKSSLRYTDIIRATKGFSEEFMLGTGGFGSVFRVDLPNKLSVAGCCQLAVKRLEVGSKQGNREFAAEMATLGSVRHRNLISLLAAYAHPTSLERWLLYEFVPGKSLDKLLQEAEAGGKGAFSNWDVRKGIAIGVARGIKYLHYDANPSIIHRDLKPGNVLVHCSTWEACVADFGLARLIEPGETHISTGLQGTIGYIAPEYANRGKLGTQADVYAFGIILLQLITGRRPTDNVLAESGGLASWTIAAAATGRAHEALDPRLKGVNMHEVVAAMRLGQLCTSEVTADRPCMADVLHVLENLMDYPSPWDSAYIFEVGQGLKDLCPPTYCHALNQDTKSGGGGMNGDVGIVELASNLTTWSLNRICGNSPNNLNQEVCPRG